MWYVIQVRAGHEFPVVDKCRKNVILPGEDVFTMVAERMFREGREWKKKADIAFQKYIFAETGDVGSFCARLRKVGETAKMLRVGNEITPIYPEEEAILRKLGGPGHIIRTSEGFRVDEKLVVTDGPMKGMEGVVRWADRRQKVAGVAVSLFGREVIVRVGVEILGRLPEGAGQGVFENPPTPPAGGGH